MKIIDVSIFCNAYEKELCLLKLQLENEVVDEFVWCENEYDYRGKHKGKILRAMLDGDPRFDPYRGKIRVISINKDFTEGKPLDGIDPVQFHNAEVYLRECSHNYIVGKYKENDRVFISDIDEVIDFTDAARRDFILGKFAEFDNDPIQFERIRYIYDFDNRAYRESMDIITPSFSVLNLQTGQAKLSDKKWVGHHIPVGVRPAIFEYCFCFPYEEILAKYNTSLHTCWSKGKIDRSLQCNFWTKTDYQGEPDLNNRWDWFEKVELDEWNSPRYIRENLDKLRTGNVPSDYKEQRFKHYGIREYKNV